jgi:hypothetical protein
MIEMDWSWLDWSARFGVTDWSLEFGIILEGWRGLDGNGRE